MIKNIILLIVASQIFLLSCKKALDAKPVKSQVVPQTLRDFQYMLDNAYTMNTGIPAVGEIASDNLIVSDVDWPSCTLTEYNGYIWQKDMFNDYDYNDWTNPYQWVSYANIVLDGLKKIDNSSDTGNYNNVKGSALFFRSHAFYQLSQEFCTLYNKSSATTDAGIVLRLNSNPNEVSVRASVENTYKQIISDLEEAASLLPVTPLYKTRPSKPAAFALLARTYLVMQDYAKAKDYADSSLALYNELLDYNTIDTTQTFPVPFFNTEVIFHCTVFNMPSIDPSIAKVDTTLLNTYNANDLRIPVFFKNNPNGGMSFYGSYDGSPSNFGGIATDEIYLIRAECNARLGNKQNAMDDLNSLLLKRYRQGTFIPLSTTGNEDALATILRERRKELILRGLRWPDLRRLNTDPSFTTIITHISNGITYTLPTNDLRYVFPIPVKVINTSRIQQNPR